MKKLFSLVKLLLPPILIGILMFALRGGKNILDGIYIIFPLIFLLQGIFCTDKIIRGAIGLALSETVFLVLVNILYKMGTCIDLALIYLAIAILAYAVKTIVKRKLKKKKDSR